MQSLTLSCSTNSVLLNCEVPQMPKRSRSKPHQVDKYGDILMKLALLRYLQTLLESGPHFMLFVVYAVRMVPNDTKLFIKQNMIPLADNKRVKEFNIEQQSTSSNNPGAVIQVYMHEREYKQSALNVYLEIVYGVVTANGVTQRSVQDMDRIGSDWRNKLLDHDGKWPSALHSRKM